MRLLPQRATSPKNLRAIDDPQKRLDAYSKATVKHLKKPSDFTTYGSDIRHIKKAASLLEDLSTQRDIPAAARADALEAVKSLTVGDSSPLSVLQAGTRDGAAHRTLMDTIAKVERLGKPSRETLDDRIAALRAEAESEKKLASELEIPEPV